MNLPNKVTTLRFILSIIYFVLLYFSIKDIQKTEYINKPILTIGLIIFIIAALSDVLDGYLARKYNASTQFGRIADPFVDKILICGSFVFFLGWGSMHDFIGSWMVLLVIVREFLVHGLRTIAEAKGISFGANIWGKQKTMIQCFTIMWGLAYLLYFKDLSEYWWTATILHSLIWLTLFTTVFSAFTYFYKIRKMLRTVVDE